jgi:hypothetical protein
MIVMSIKTFYDDVTAIRIETVVKQSKLLLNEIKYTLN